MKCCRGHSTTTNNLIDNNVPNVAIDNLDKCLALDIVFFYKGNL